MPYQPWQNPYLPQGHQYQPNYMTAGGTYQMAQQSRLESKYRKKK